jgi:hypothetical protein
MIKQSLFINSITCHTKVYFASLLTNREEYLKQMRMQPAAVVRLQVYVHLIVLNVIARLEYVITWNFPPSLFQNKNEQNTTLWGKNRFTSSRKECGKHSFRSNKDNYFKHSGRKV